MLRNREKIDLLDPAGRGHILHPVSPVPARQWSPAKMPAIGDIRARRSPSSSCCWNRRPRQRPPNTTDHLHRGEPSLHRVADDRPPWLVLPPERPGGRRYLASVQHLPNQPAKLHDRSRPLQVSLADQPPPVLTRIQEENRQTQN
jgi:hypothetical protein